jgi:hypothetical protein
VRAKTIDAVLPNIGHVRIRVYHACAAFHCGTVLGPNLMGRWWAERGLGDWVWLWDIDDIHAEPLLEELIVPALPSPADLARRAQDERYEGPDA